jgi:hypothetical protein
VDVAESVIVLEKKSLPLRIIENLDTALIATGGSVFRDHPCWRIFAKIRWYSVTLWILQVDDYRTISTAAGLLGENAALVGGLPDERLGFTRKTPSRAKRAKISLASGLTHWQTALKMGWRCESNLTCLRKRADFIFTTEIAFLVSL